MDDFDTRVRARLLVLAEAATRDNLIVPTHRLRRRQGVRSGAPVGVAAAAFVFLAVAAVGSRFVQQASVAPSASATTATTATAAHTPWLAPSPLPSGGISMTQATWLAQQATTAKSAAVVSAVAGRFGDLDRSQRGGGVGIADDRLVWLVTLTTTTGGASYYLDYYSGELLSGPLPSPAATPLPSGGITESRAIELAEQQQNGPGRKFTFLGADTGLFGDLKDPHFGPGLGVADSRSVWRVTLSGWISGAQVCHMPPLHPSPVTAVETALPTLYCGDRVGTMTYWFDYRTGELVASIGSFPQP